MSESYQNDFYKLIEQGVKNSAKVIVPILANQFEPGSVVDIGCGTGEWLAQFKNNGITTVFGIDGPWVENTQLAIAPEEFAPMNLTQPLDASELPVKQFDLALCLEVGEHLNASCSELLVRNLTRISSVILFSAAIPGQGGVDHVNEQWQSYWAELFGKHDFTAIDWLRPKIWDHPKVDTWYKQNTLLYISSDRLQKWPAISESNASGHNLIANVVHPAHYMQKLKDTDPNQMSLINTLKKLPRIFKSALKRKL